MAKIYPINPVYGVYLTDDGQIVPVNSKGIIDLDDREELLKLMLASAVEIDYLHGELVRAASSIGEALKVMRPPSSPVA